MVKKFVDQFQGKTSVYLSNTESRYHSGEPVINDALAEAIAEALRLPTSTVEELYIRESDIKDAGATALAGALKENNTLTILDLSDNYIGDKGAAALAEASKVNKTLETLDLSENSGLTSEAEGSLNIIKAEMAKNKRIKALHANKNLWTKAKLLLKIAGHSDPDAAFSVLPKEVIIKILFELMNVEPG